MLFGRRIEATQVLGLALLGVAAAYAMAPSYPVAQTRSPAQVYSADSRPELGSGPAPRPASPIGAVEGALPWFEWDYQGEDPRAGFELLLLADDLSELHRSAPVHERRLDPVEHCFSSRIRPSERYHWQVQIAGRPETRSAPYPLRRGRR